MRSKPTDVKLTNLFLDMLAAEQGAGDNTLQAYRRDLTDFSEFLARSGQSFAAADTQQLRDYLADLDTRGFKSSSVARRLSAMRHLFRWPRPAKSALDIGRRPHAGAGERADD
jgi:integrase/recombinase XerD